MNQNPSGEQNTAIEDNADVIIEIDEATAEVLKAEQEAFEDTEPFDEFLDEEEDDEDFSMTAEELREYLYGSPNAPIQPSLEGRTDRLPVLVYGTLRHGEGNYAWCLNGRTAEETTVNVLGMEMHGQTGFPYVFQAEDEDSDAIIVAELMTLQDDVYEEAMRDLDRLEGYRGPGVSNHYDRIVVTVNDGENDVEAYIYVGHPHLKEDVRSRDIRIADGDWVAHTRRYRGFDPYA